MPEESISKPEVNEGAEKQLPEAVPYSRFAKVNHERKAAQEEVKALRDRLAAHERSQAEAQGQFQKLYEDAKGQIATLQSQMQAIQVAALRTRIGADVGLPGALAERLVGEDEDSLRADAERLKALLPAAPPPVAPPAPPVKLPQVSPGNPAAHSGALTVADLKSMTPQQILARIDEARDAFRRERGE